MSWLTLDLVTKIIVPVGTFALGIFVTNWTKRRDAKRLDSRSRAAEAVVLLSEWYNQIHELDVDLHYKLKGRARKRAIDGYVGSRKVLPKLTQVRETLAEAGDQPELVAEIDGFLGAVTHIDFRETPLQKALASSAIESVSSPSGDWRDYRVGCVPYDESLRNSLIRELDMRVQRASRLAAKTLV